MSDTAIPLIELQGITRAFPAGDETVTVLEDVNLRIHAGEMLAIIGPSGSGKSTLMNIIGCLDQPTQGSYRFTGRPTEAMSPDELAALRREHFGFVFQRYQLLGGLSAQGNVEMPAIYAGASSSARHARATELLTRLGLQDRLQHKPGQLSGGQQQRVSIARALMNGGAVVLADEPTGALDSATGEQVMRILQELNAAGHTIILVTHDAKVASHAPRVVRIEDGRIVRDEASRDTPLPQAAPSAPAPALSANAPASAFVRMQEAARMAWHAMAAHRMRTLLTMLGIIIGIVSVVLVNALGEGAKRQILQDISALGTNTIDVLPGKDFGDLSAAAVNNLRADDAHALAALPFVHSVTPLVQTSLTVRHGSREKTTTVYGVGVQHFEVRGERLAEGVLFDNDSVRRLSLDAVINPHARRALFAEEENPLGKIILLGNTPARVIGVTAPRANNFGPSQGIEVWLPYTTVMGRLTGSQNLQTITVRLRDGAPAAQAEADITRLLRLRHGGAKDFFTHNSDTFRATVEKTTLVLRLFISSIAVIALVVGGIGVMNIMLVSVTERTHEIGIRMAVGARRADILQQFLIEAVFVCLLGGVLGIALALGLGWGIDKVAAGQFRLVFSVQAIALAVVCASLIGLSFGYWPARNAARLNPVEALARQ